MASSSNASSAPAPSAPRSQRRLSELKDELRRAFEDLANGDYIELTTEQLERCIVTGESPWRESRG